MTTTEYTFGDYNVSLALEEDAPLGKLDDLHICHLGMKFISARQIPEFNVYEFEMSLKAANGEPSKVKCCGVVVKSEPEGDGFRTVIHFAGMANSDVSCLEAVTKAQKMRCDYCANC
ncbi:MAG: hypothetical protein EOM72_01515 [Opitutae bacterium]|nr:hypothetical protein [Opitutae bacterium]